MIDLNAVAAELRDNDDFLILCHMNPDGDTIGSAFALLSVLKLMGKKGFVCCSDEPADQYAYMMGDEEINKDDSYSYVIAVDIADQKLVGAKYEHLADKIDLAIDHHKSNTMYAKKSYVDMHAAATCEIIYDIVKVLNFTMDKNMANCIYTGISTDTCCFRYSNTTDKTHFVAAETIKCGADYHMINRVMFDTKSLKRIRVEQMALNTLSLHFGNKCAVIKLTQEMLRKSGANEDELEGVSAIPRQIEGVVVGVLLREKPDGTIRVSLRTEEPIDAAVICTLFGGGGHKRAAGCIFECDIDSAKEQLLKAIETVI